MLANHIQPHSGMQQIKIIENKPVVKSLAAIFVCLNMLNEAILVEKILKNKS